MRKVKYRFKLIIIFKINKYIIKTYNINLQFLICLNEKSSYLFIKTFYIKLVDIK